MKGACDRISVKPDIIEDVQVGTVLAPGGGATQVRMAMFLAGFPETVSISTTNRQCSSGLQSFAAIASAIRAGYIEVGMACGVESMSNHDMMSAVGSLNDKVFENAKAKDSLIPMGQTSENVAEQFGISREEQDAFALKSYEKAMNAIKSGNFKDEIVPITVKVTKADGSVAEVTVSTDEGPRETKLADLQKLKPAFKQGGTTTAGNSSQVSDGAAAVIAMTRRKAKELGLKPLGRFISFSVVGVPPEIMGIGPAVAIPDVLKKSGVKLSQIDQFEINEAFASQAYYTIKKLGIDESKVNPNGGAIALGHPLGATGARQIATLLYGLKKSKGKYGIISMCIGTGMGAAGLFCAE